MTAQFLDLEEDQISDVDSSALSFSVLPPASERKADLELGTLLHGYASICTRNSMYADLIHAELGKADESYFHPKLLVLQN